MTIYIYIILTVILAAGTVFGQAEILTNAAIVEMSGSGLGKQIILKKIETVPNRFEVSAGALVELKKAGVENEVISAMLDKAGKIANTVDLKPSANPAIADSETGPPKFSESRPETEAAVFDKTIPSARDALAGAKSVAIVKSSLNPSRQALEKALFKRAAWGKYNLAIVRYKEQADLYLEIGRIPLSWITHRYVFRLYDRRTGAVLTAGETTSWGSLAENMAREITQKMDRVMGK
jgi:hypothetical protein